MKTRWLRFLVALVVALVLMLCFRALVFTVCTIEGRAFLPYLRPGDRVLVNRWSYGLRVGGDGSPFGYGRIGRRSVSRGDRVAFENPQRKGEMLMGCCTAVPGDTVNHEGQMLVVPGRATCADTDYYWLVSVGWGSDREPDWGNPSSYEPQPLGLISEKQIIGRVMGQLYRHKPGAPFWRGWHFYFDWPL